ncbi:MAG: hypothetical protein ACKKL4_00250 [Patescibacteria group bacterium]
MKSTGIGASFIPKEEVRAKGSRHTPLASNLFLLIGIVVFLAALLASLGIFLWHGQLESANARALQTLEKNRENYGISAIEEFIDINNRIQAADQILSQHISVAPIFAMLELDTLTDIYLQDFSFTTEGNEVLISARGFAPTYAHVALQADQYSDNNLIKDLILSGVNQAREGGIQFDVSFVVDRDILIVN